MWTVRRSNAVRPTSETRFKLMGCSERYLTYSASALFDAATWYLPSCNLKKQAYSDFA